MIHAFSYSDQHNQHAVQSKLQNTVLINLKQYKQMHTFKVYILLHENLKTSILVFFHNVQF